MRVANFSFFEGHPVVLATFHARRSREPIVRRLLIDSGFTGKSAFVLSQDDCERFRRRYAPPNQVAGALIGMHQRVWVKCSIPLLGMDANLVAISSDLASCSLPAGINGMAGLSFLNEFHRWGAERLSGGNWQFFLETA